MHEYKLSPLFFSQMRRRILILVPVILILGLVGGFMVGGRITQADTTFLIIIPILFIVLAYSIMKNLRQQEKLWSSYRLIQNDSSIKRIQDGFTEITISYSEISKIIEAPQIGLTIQASTPPRQIFIPYTLAGYAQLRIDLASKHPIDLVPKSQSKFGQFFPFLLVILSIILFVVTFKSANVYISAMAGILLFIGLAISLVVIQRSPQLPKKTRWGGWFVLFPLFAIASRVVLDILQIIKSIQ